MSATSTASQITARVFDQVAKVYDAPLLQRVVYRPSQDVVVAELRRRRPRRIADVGCGTGVLTARLAEDLEYDRLYGFDLSAGMLAQARAKGPAVDWQQAPAEHLPLPDCSLGALVTTEAFHFFDQPVALREFHRVLEPGGCLIVASVNTPVTGIGRLLPGGPSWSTPGEVRRLVEDAGFTLDRQERVGRLLARSLFPTFATIATRP